VEAGRALVALGLELASCPAAALVPVIGADAREIGRELIELSAIQVSAAQFVRKLQKTAAPTLRQLASRV